MRWSTREPETAEAVPRASFWQLPQAELERALGSGAGGLVLGLWGFGALNAIGAVLVAVPLAAIWFSPGAIAAAPAPSPAGPSRA